MSVDRYDARTALLVVDVQNDFADPSGSSTWPAARGSCR
jgi:nicotinamidase-related amidase